MVSSYYLIPSYHFHIFWSSPSYHLITSYHPVTSLNQLVCRTARSTDDLEPSKKKIKVEQEDLSTEAEVANLQQPWLEQTFGMWIGVITWKSMLHYWEVICLGFHKDIQPLKANHHGCLTLSAWGWSLASTTAQRSLLVGTEVWCTWRAKESAPTFLTEKCNSIQTSLNPKQTQVNQGLVGFRPQANPSTVNQHQTISIISSGSALALVSGEKDRILGFICYTITKKSANICFFMGGSNQSQCV